MPAAAAQPQVSEAASTTATVSKAGMVYAPDSPLAKVVRMCDRLAHSDATVLVTGETGTGKEVIARYLHEHGGRAGHAFVPVNCAAIPEALLEATLFGHAKGAFTGAASAQRGRLAYAEGGTLFLDEIGELPLSLQVKLLRVLEERSYEPVGSAESVSANFRLVAATNRDLAKEVDAGRFRRDLYYRLNVCPVELPALRDRRTDIALLFGFFWNQLGEQRPVDQAVIQTLLDYPWPGNVRELRNLCERISVCCDGQSIRLRDVPAPFRPTLVEEEPEELRDGAVPEFLPVLTLAPPAEEPVELESARPLEDEPPQGRPVAVEPERSGPWELAGADMTLRLPAEGQLQFPVDLAALMRQLEDAYIDAALTQAAGSRKDAAAMLGLQRTTLCEKLRRRDARSASSKP